VTKVLYTGTEAAAITRTGATPLAFRNKKDGEAENDENLKLYDEESTRD
jgi:hypothetical protein